MSRRIEHTRRISQLVNEMFSAGEQPIYDYMKRSAAEQRRLFEEGKSKCDGIKRVSKHQQGRATDIYFVSDDGLRLVDPTRGWGYWHQRWEDLGGAPMIDWDKGHFES